MGANQNSISELGIYPKSNPMPLSPNTTRTTQLSNSYWPSEPDYELQQKHESVSARTHARSTIEIISNNSIYPHRQFTEHLVSAFGKSPWESNLNRVSNSRA
jgi:hypothetical protein